MSVFHNSFNLFECYIDFSFRADFEMVVPDAPDGSVASHDTDQQFLPDGGDFDPFAWVASILEPGPDGMADLPGVEAGSVGWIPESALGPDGGLSDAVGGNWSGGNDHFWSTNFSAGNSNADNTQGYVSVPGVGPVSYGM